jgi:putative mycofactocin binding protein MftB
VRGLLTTGFDPNRRYRLHPRVALRPEPFGALAYHYGNRRLNFLRSPDLVDLVNDLANHPTVDEALGASSIDPRRHPAFRKALADLAASDFLEEVP